MQGFAKLESACLKSNTKTGDWKTNTTNVNIGGNATLNVALHSKDTHLNSCFSTVESNTLNKYIKTIHNIIKNLITEVKTLLSPTETWERKCGPWERRHEQPTGEFKVRA